MNGKAESVSTLRPGTGPRVDVGALAGAIAHDASAVLASTLSYAITSLEEADRALNELEVIELIQAALLQYDGFERKTCQSIRRALAENGVEAWGISPELEQASRPHPRGEVA